MDLIKIIEQHYKEEELPNEISMMTLVDNYMKDNAYQQILKEKLEAELADQIVCALISNYFDRFNIVPKVEIEDGSIHIVDIVFVRK